MSRYDGDSNGTFYGDVAAGSMDGDAGDDQFVTGDDVFGLPFPGEADDYYGGDVIPIELKIRTTELRLGVRPH